MMSDCKELSRRQFLSAVVSTAAVSRLPVTGAAILAGESTPALAQYTEVSASVEAPQTCQVDVHWDKAICASRTFPTAQAVVNPLLRRTSSIHNRVFESLRDLNADYVRYVPWLPYPKLDVADLDPPTNGRTSWDFSLIDPMMEDFMNATAGHPVIVNFSTIPQWMFKTSKPVSYPSDADQVDWEYEQGTELRDPSMKEVAEYCGRLVSWYTQGGFRDEYGHEHISGHRYKIDYWEILNEVNFEHRMTPQFYTALYDAVAEAIHKADPEIKFVGLALAGTSPNTGRAGDASKYFEYFLNHKNHKSGIPLDMISYHCYASLAADEDLSAAQFTFFEQADNFLDEVRYIESIRKRLSPETRTTIDETGTILPDDFSQAKTGYVSKPIPNAYWNLSAAIYAYLYAQLVLLGIDVVGESQFVGYPTQFPSVSMIDWTTGQPNARYWALKLLHENFGPGDKLVESHNSVPYVYVQGFVTQDGKQKLLLVNKRNRPFNVTITGIGGGKKESVDQTTGEGPPISVHLGSNTLLIGGFGVVVVCPNHQ